MIQLHATHKLFKSLPPNDSCQFAATPCSQWLFTQPTIELNDHFVDAFINTLLKCGADEMQLNVAQNYLRPPQVDTQCSRSVLGTLNQMKGDIEHVVRFDNRNISESAGYALGQSLADRPCSVKNRGYLWPQQEMLSLLSQLAAHL